MWPVPPLSRRKEADMENQNNSRGDAAPGQPVYNADVQRWAFAEYERGLTDFEAQRLAAFLEEVAAQITRYVQVLRGR